MANAPLGTIAFSDLWNGIKEAASFVGDTFFGGSHSTNEANMTLNRENIAFQQHENEITRQREDTAVQRAAQDMTAAGLSKTLAAGHPASAQSMTAPSNSISMEKNLAGLNALNSITKLYFDKQANERANKLNDAQVDLVESQAKGQQLNNETFMDKFFNEQLLTTAKTEETKASVLFIQSQQKVQDIIGSYKEEELRASIDKVYVDIAHTKASIELTTEQKNKIISEVQNIVQDTLLKEWQGKKTEQEIQNLSREYALSWYKIESMKHDLNYAQNHGYPVGAFPSGLLGGAINIGDYFGTNGTSLGNIAHRLLWEPLVGKDTGFYKLLFEPHGFKFLNNLYGKSADAVQGFGGWLLDSARNILNFSPLNWLLNR